MTELAHELFDDGATPAQPESIQQRLQRARQDIAENRTYDIDIPGYDGNLYGRYKLLDGPALNRIAQNVTKTIKDKAERGMAASIDTLVTACVEMRVRDGGRDLSLAEVIGEEEPVRYDMRLAEFLDFHTDLGEHPSARSVLRATFVGNDVAIGAHNQRLSRWMMGNGVSVDEELLADFG